MKINALITAKSNSTRIPYKNVTFVAGKQLYKWTTDFLERYYFMFENIYFSSNKPEMFGFSGTKIRAIKRPAILCSDSLSHMATVKHAISRMIRDGSNPDYIMLFQPTNPFRSFSDIVSAIKIVRDNNSVDMVCSHYHDDNLEPSYIRHARNSHPSDTAVKIKSGNLYLWRRRYISEGHLGCYVSIRIPKYRGYNINVPSDIPIAEALYKYNY